MIDLQDVQDYVDETYNYAITAYDYGDRIRVTNGSAGMYGDVKIREETLRLEGERYGEPFAVDREPTIESLQMALSECLGL